MLSRTDCSGGTKPSSWYRTLIGIQGVGELLDTYPATLDASASSALFCGSPLLPGQWAFSHTLTAGRHQLYTIESSLLHFGCISSPQCITRGVLWLVLGYLINGIRSSDDVAAVAGKQRAREVLPYLPPLPLLRYSISTSIVWVRASLLYFVKSVFTFSTSIYECEYGWHNSI